MKRITGYLCLLTAISFTAAADANTLSRELKELRNEKRQIAVVANELGALARGSQLNSWQTHATALEQLRELINKSGARIERIQLHAGGAIQASELRDQLAAVAKHVTAMKNSLRENQNAMRMPPYYREAMMLVQTAEQSQTIAERVISAALTRGPATQTAD